MRYTDDPPADWDTYCREQEAAMILLPVCCECGKRIEDDRCWDVYGDIFCEDCAEKKFRKWTVDVMDG